MGSAWNAIGLFGREGDSARLAAVLAGAGAGEPGALVIHGEAGVGKTALVRAVVGTFVGERLWGSCVHFGVATVPFGAITSALDGWAAAAGESAGQEVLAGLGALSARLPSRAFAGQGGAEGLLTQQLETAILRIAQRGPTVLVIDDLHWADPSTLDLLAFLVSGFRDQRLAVLLTVRDEDRPEGHRLNGWLADLRRMPGVGETHLERLDLAATTQQVEALLGDVLPSEGFTGATFTRSEGNPYLTELLVQGLHAGPSASVPEALREALLSRWHSMTKPARDLARLLAFAGRPTQVEVLTAVAQALAPAWDGGATLRPLLAEAAAAALVAPADDRVWFRHPLVAEVLTTDRSSLDAPAVHEAYAQVLAGSGRAAAGDVALHYELAGDAAQAYRWSLVAAESAAGSQGATERLECLRRACRLWPQVAGDHGGPAEHVDLLLRTARAAQGLARPQEALSFLNEALSLTDPTASPRMACRLLTLQHRMLVEAEHLSWTTTTAPLKEAQALAALLPGTPEGAIVAAQSAWIEEWSGSEEARTLSAAALHTARTTNAPDALIPALVIAAMTHPDHPDAMAWLQEAYQLAATDGDDAMEMADAAVGMNNHHNIHGEYAAAIDSSARCGADLIRAGAPSVGRFLLTSAGLFSLVLGRWSQAEAYLRPALASADGGHREGTARSTMAILCARRGDIQQAQRHLDRAREVTTTEYMGTCSYPYGQVELLLARSQPDQALRIIESQIAAATLVADARDGDEFLLLAARAASDLARSGRDRRQPEPTTRAETLLARVLAAWSSCASESFVPWSPADRIQIARKTLYDAELSHLRDLPTQPHQWSLATQACHAADLKWEEGLAACRHGQTLLTQGGSKADASTALHLAHSIAGRLGAAPLLNEVEAIAPAAHIRLNGGEPMPGPDQAPADGLAGLTTREREVLAHVVAGRSNGEIAAALFISDKTVSVHISNILRKSGTSTRVQAAAWAARMGSTPPHIKASPIDSQP